jgi:predicted O-linked N-acetylglucosamine transferase (SPINDLY family)
MLENHDRHRFEVYAFSFGSDRRDDWRTRVEKAVDRFVDVHTQSDSDIAALARDMGIDIAIDLNGFTKNFRMGIFAERAAPLQVSYIGYLGTSGAPFIDYLVAEATIIPEDKQNHYSEQIVYLPCYQGSDYSRTASTRIWSKAELGLPQTGFVYCSFNSNYKITPEVYARWMNILIQVPDSVLWLYVTNPNAIENLRHQAERLGVSAQRIIFAQSIPREDHLSRMGIADLFLDTFPCNAGATATDALWMGLPILTLIGESFASRVAASLIAAVGLGELITHTPQEYTELAIRLATNSDLLSTIRQRLADHLPGCQLFDSLQFTRNIESAYVAIYERHERGLAPMHLHVPPKPSAH